MGQGKWSKTSSLASFFFSQSLFVGQGLIETKCSCNRTLRPGKNEIDGGGGMKVINQLCFVHCLRNRDGTTDSVAFKSNDTSSFVEALVIKK